MVFEFAVCSGVQNLKGFGRKSRAMEGNNFLGLGKGSCFPARLGRVHLAAAARPKGGEI